MHPDASWGVERPYHDTGADDVLLLYPLCGLRICRAIVFTTRSSIHPTSKPECAIRTILRKRTNPGIGVFCSFFWCDHRSQAKPLGTRTPTCTYAPAQWAVSLREAAGYGRPGYRCQCGVAVARCENETEKRCMRLEDGRAAVLIECRGHARPPTVVKNGPYRCVGKTECVVLARGEHREHNIMDRVQKRDENEPRRGDQELRRHALIQRHLPHFRRLISDFFTSIERGAQWSAREGGIGEVLTSRICYTRTR